MSSWPQWMEQSDFLSLYMIEVFIQLHNLSVIYISTLVALLSANPIFFSKQNE